VQPGAEHAPARQLADTYLTALGDGDLDAPTA